MLEAVTAYELRKEERGKTSCVIDYFRLIVVRDA